jgi:hypothetical protein
MPKNPLYVRLLAGLSVVIASYALGVRHTTISPERIAAEQGLCRVTGVFPGANPEKMSLVGIRVDERRILAFSAEPVSVRRSCFGPECHFPERVEVEFQGKRAPFFLLVQHGEMLRSSEHLGRLWLWGEISASGLSPLPAAIRNRELKPGTPVWIPEMADDRPFWLAERRLNGIVETSELVFQTTETRIEPASGAPVFDMKNRFVGVFIRDSRNPARQRVVPTAEILAIVTAQE